eukprot:GEZU01026926.1.p1 GENE.GEZU01026926.1~~GEZU01026926.1.p1  ORF type:complete len:102 (-),score=3.10 GEZU01026926.1:3-308(-)
MMDGIQRCLESQSPTSLSNLRRKIWNNNKHIDNILDFVHCAMKTRIHTSSYITFETEAHAEEAIKNLPHRSIESSGRKKLNARCTCCSSSVIVEVYNSKLR